MKRQIDKYTYSEKAVSTQDLCKSRKCTNEKKDLYSRLYPNEKSNSCFTSDYCTSRCNKSKYYDCSLKSPICEIPKDEFIIDTKFINCYEHFNYSNGFEEIAVSKGGYLEISLKPSDCEVRGDIVINNEHTFVLWGEIRNHCNMPVSDLLVTLLKPIYIRGICKYIAEASTKTNCIGFYQFNISEENKDLKYKILLGNNCN